MLERHLAVPLHRAAREAPLVLLEGPRGSGKTTLLRREFPHRLYVTLNETADRRAARQDPEAFVLRLRAAAIIDDVHRAPELASYLARTPAPKPLILASSRKLGLPVRTLRLYHPTRAERERRPALPLEMLGHFAPRPAERSAIASAWPIDRGLIDRDVQELVRIQDMDRLEAFICVALEASGRVLDVQELARQAGLSRTTAVRWLAALDACFLTLTLPPYNDDFGRRLVRSPKLHFMDGGTFESAVVSEIYRNAANTGQIPDLRYWRDSNGLEIPLVVQLAGVAPMAVAIAETPNPTDESRLQRWMSLAEIQKSAMISIYPREQRRGPILRYSLNQL